MSKFKVRMQPSIATAILGCVVLFKFFAPSSFAIDSPPDLVLEVEYSRSAIDKLRLYAGMGVPEFWRYNGSVLRIYTLAGGQYSEVQTSPIFAAVSMKEIPRFLQEAKKNGEIATTRAFRIWVQQKISAGE